MTHNTLMLSLIAALSLAACTAPVDRPLTVDGTRNANFDSDYNACHAQAASFTNGAGAESAAVGAVIGAGVGAIEADDEWEGAVVGAITGGAIGAAENASKVNDERRHVLIRCMQNRGHDVIG